MGKWKGKLLVEVLAVADTNDLGKNESSGLADVRAYLNLSEERMAKLLRVRVETLQRWERERPPLNGRIRELVESAAKANRLKLARMLLSSVQVPPGVRYELQGGAVVTLQALGVAA